MKIIPVIDILNGKVVHAKKGQRNQYKPIQSSLTDSADPVAVAKAFKHIGFQELYVADLDAIIDCTDDFGVLKQMATETGLSLMVDAGITSLERAQKLLDCGVAKVIIGTETLRNADFVAKAVKALGSDRVVVSLDFKSDRVLAKAGFEGCSDPLCMLEGFKKAGLLGVIILDLARVGSGEGVNLDFLRRALGLGGLDVYVGGGVRDFEDLQVLAGLGVAGVLVASALHSGKISVDALKNAGFL